MAHIKALAAVVLYLAAVASAAGHHRATSGPREPNVTVDTFGYTGLDGPLNWFGLNTSANGLCARGRNQSPINLNSSIPLGPGSNTTISVDSYPNGTTFENLGATIEVPSNGTLVAGGQSYKLAQFHFHTPSEHRVNLEYFPMEMHFVFETPEDTDAVVAFLVDIGGPADPLLTSIFTYVSDIATPGEATLTGPLDFTNLAHHLTSNEIYFYSGSLTTPPCTESVPWIISAKPIHIDQGTYNKVRNVLGFNARYTQNNLGGVNLLQNIANELAQS